MPRPKAPPAKDIVELEPDRDEPSASVSGGIIEFDPDAPRPSAASVHAQAVATADTMVLHLDWFKARDELEARLLGASPRAAITAQSVPADKRPSRILGVGLGFKYTGGVLSGDVAAKVFVADKLPLAEVNPAQAVPSSVAGLPTDVEEIGDVVAKTYSFRYDRPVHCGVSVGHVNITAGTIGCLVLLKNNHLCILSNNHVLADENAGMPGDEILQPGKIDGGVSPADVIAALESFMPVNPLGQGDNLVDAAVAHTAFRFVDPSHMTYTLDPTTAAATLGMTVMKNGRTTQSTLGVVTDLAFTVQVGYSFGPAQFRDQLVIRGVGGNPFSAGGDSGSLIVTANTKQPVALLFAGPSDNSVTFANPIAAVIDALGIQRFVNSTTGDAG